MDKNTLIFIFVLFMISTKLWNVTWNIGTSLFYLVIAIIVLNSISPETSQDIKNFISRLINLDTSLITNGLASLSKFLLNLFNNSKEIIQESKDILYNKDKLKENKVKDETFLMANTPLGIANKPIGEISRNNTQFKNIKIPVSMAQLGTTLSLQNQQSQSSTSNQASQSNQPSINLPSISDINNSIINQSNINQSSINQSISEESTIKLPETTEPSGFDQDNLLNSMNIF